MAILNVFHGALLALLLAVQPALAGNDASGDRADSLPYPHTCVFGMPESSFAVGRDNGFVTEVLRAALAPAGYHLVYRDLPYRRARGELAHGTIQCSLTARDTQDTPGKARSVIAACDLVVAYLSAHGFTGVDELAGQKVAHLYGYDFEHLLPVNIRPQTTYDRVSAIQMLDRGHVRYVIGEETLLKDAVHQAGLPLAEFGFSRFLSLDVVPIFAATAEGHLLREIFDRRMGEMAASGELETIYRKYGLSEERIRHILQTDRD